MFFVDFVFPTFVSSILEPVVPREKSEEKAPEPKVKLVPLFDFQLLLEWRRTRRAVKKLREKLDEQEPIAVNARKHFIET